MRTLLSILALWLLPLSLKAQHSYTGNASGNISVSSIQSVTLTGGTAIPAFTTADDYLNGVVMPNYLSVAIKSNVSWTLSVSAQNAFFTPMSQGGSTDMPASVLSIKPSNSANYFNLSANSQTLKTGNKGNATASGNSFSIDVKYNPGYSYKGAVYTLGLVYTLSQQ